MWSDATGQVKNLDFFLAMGFPLAILLSNVFMKTLMINDGLFTITGSPTKKYHLFPGNRDRGIQADGDPGTSKHIIQMLFSAQEKKLISFDFFLIL